MTHSPDHDAVVFDIGGVLLDWNPRHLYRKLISDEAEMEAFLRDVCTIEWHASHDLGVPFSESCAALTAIHPEHAELIRAWGERSEEMIAGPIEETVAILDELLQRGVRCYALTNMERETYSLRVDRYPFMRRFAGTIVSSHEGVAKPDPAIFRVLLTRFALDPRRVVMIDDSVPNIEAAVGIGMTAIRFITPDALRTSLHQLSLLP